MSWHITSCLTLIETRQMFRDGEFFLNSKISLRNLVMGNWFLCLCNIYISLKLSRVWSVNFPRNRDNSWYNYRFVYQEWYIVDIIIDFYIFMSVCMIISIHEIMQYSSKHVYLPKILGPIKPDINFTWGGHADISIKSVRGVFEFVTFVFRYWLNLQHFKSL